MSINAYFYYREIYRQMEVNNFQLFVTFYSVMTAPGLMPYSALKAR